MRLKSNVKSMLLLFTLLSHFMNTTTHDCDCPAPPASEVLVSAWLKAQEAPPGLLKSFRETGLKVSRNRSGAEYK
jgi:hypothetical protein